MDAMPIDVPRQAGIYVRRAREARDMTRARLAAESGVSERLLASLELGDATGIRLDKLLGVFGALGLSLTVQGEGVAAGSAGVALPAVGDPAPRQAPVAPSPQVSSYDELYREIAREQGITLVGEGT